jgi:orotate phosphoribosyltransferase
VPVKGERVALVEDVVTTGGSAFRALEALAPAGVLVAEAIVLVDREEGAEAALLAQSLPLHALFRRSEFGTHS